MPVSEVSDDILELRAEFLAETVENMVELDLDLVTLEKDPGNAALLDRVFRLVHTIKGAAGFLDMPSPPCRAPPMRLSFSAGKRGSIPS